MADPGEYVVGAGVLVGGGGCDVVLAVSGVEAVELEAAERADVLEDREGPFEVVVARLDGEEHVGGGVEGGDQVASVGLIDVVASLRAAYYSKDASDQAAFTIAVTQSSIAAMVMVVS